MGFMDIVHGVLDVAGFIPVVGAVADVANAAIYAAEGDWGNAALSLVSAVPGVGDAVGAVGKGGKLLLKGMKLAEDAVSKGKKILSSFGRLTGKAKTGAKKITNKRKRKKKVEEAKTESKHECTNGKCFTGDTLICTKQGLRPIKEIRKGDDIYSRNERTGETGFCKVEDVFCTEAYTIYHICLDGKAELKTTAYHPFFVKDRGWVKSINLRENDVLETMEGTVCITQIRKVRHEEPVAVYNFHVEDWESYFVSESWVYVHNTDGEHVEEELEEINEEHPFYKEGGGSDPDGFISDHAYDKHKYNPDTISTQRRTQYGENVDVGKLQEDTMQHPDLSEFNENRGINKYVKTYDFNISTPDTPTGRHEVYINSNRPDRSSQFPRANGGNQ